MSEMFYVQNDKQEYLCEGEEIGWSRFVIDATNYSSEEEANQAIKRLGLIFCGVGWRSGPPQEFLYKNNPYSKEERIRKDGQLPALERKLRAIEGLPELNFVKEYSNRWESFKKQGGQHV
jgi:hypothetical protein